MNNFHYEEKELRAVEKNIQLAEYLFIDIENIHLSTNDKNIKN